jgi:outer membrane protein OmpA-like peptidoglycan-associated protein
MVVSTGGHTVSDLLERGREIRFDPGTSKLLDASLPFLTDLAAVLAQEPTTRLEIVVHTADSGDAKRDMTLSKRRAEAVKHVLVVKGANAAQLLATGRGSEDPVAPNLTRTGRLRNERVELHRVSSPAPGW